MKTNKILISLLAASLVGSGLLAFKTLSLARQNQELVRDNQELEEKVHQVQVRGKNQARLEKYENNKPNLTSKEIRFFGPDSFKTDFKEDKLDLIFHEFIDPLTWESLGFSVENSQTIGETLKKNMPKTNSIITGMLRKGKNLKLILLPKGNNLILKYGLEDPNQMEAVEGKTRLSKSLANSQGIRRLEMDIAYGSQAVEVDYSVYKNQVRSSLENEVSQVYLYGEEAKDLIETSILGLNFPATRDLAIEESLKLLGLKKDFTSYRISLDYENGQNFNYRLEK